jgi:hypothetical protein
MASSIFLIALLLAAVFSVSLTAANAQEAGMTQPLSGKSLDVRVEPQWSDDSQARFKVSFLKPSTESVQQHIDYNVVIKDKDGKQLFSTAQGGQAVQHTAEGVVTIPQVPTPPFKFPGNGQYDIEVSVAGINFVPMNTETATFSVNVTPEFPVGVVGAVMAALVGATVVLRKFKIGLKI